MKDTLFFIQQFKKIHGDTYNYSLVEYVGWDNKIKIICSTHGIFEQTPRCHLKTGCFKCSNVKISSNKEEFIKKCIKKHGDRFDYSLVEYINNRHKVKIICKKHGVFEQNAQNHLNGRGCIKCSNCDKKDTENFIKNAKLIHGDKYDYSLVDYKNRENNVKIICKEHGIFNQKPYAHLRGSICLKCYAKNKCDNREDFINRSEKLHNNIYDYSLVKYKISSEKVKIICKKHGIFMQTPCLHLRGCGCKICKNSSGENKITNFLIDNNIIFEREKRFKNCRNIYPLPFDFYLPKYNYCIEYDGKQHFEKFWFEKNNSNLEIREKLDNIKNIYCQENNIKLYRIKYNDNLIKKLTEILK